MERRTFVTTAGATLASLALAGCSELADNGNETNGTPEDFDPFVIDGERGSEVDDSVELVSHDIYETPDDVGVTGVVENADDEPLEFVEVEVTLNDGDSPLGEFVDTSEEELDYLAPGERWRFRVSFDDEEASAATDYTIEVDAEVAEDADTVTPTEGDDGTATPTEGTPDDQEGQTPIEGAIGENVDERVQVVSHTIFETADAVGVTGVIENTAGEPLEFVEVEVTLNDGDTLIGEFIDTSDEELDFLGAGEQWRFSVAFDDEELTNATDYTIEVEAEVAEDVNGGTETATA